MSAHREERKKKKPTQTVLLMYLKSSTAWIHPLLGSTRLVFVAKYDSWKDRGKQCVWLAVGCELHR